MQVILRSDLDGVGKRGDIIDVSDGHARNYLLPRGLAMKASPGAVSQAAAMRRSRDLRDAADRESAETVAQALVAKVITVSVKAGRGGRLFGSVTSTDIADAISAQTGIEIDRRRLQLDEPIKTLGEHVLQARLHSDVHFPITVDVIALA